MLWVLLCRQPQRSYKVCGVARGGEGAGAGGHLVQRAHVRLLGLLGGGEVLHVHRVEPDDRHGREQLRRHALGHGAHVAVPPRPLQEEAVHKHPRVGRRRHVLEVLPAHLGPELERVDGEPRGARVHLQRRRHEPLREEEGREPEGRGRAVEDPALEHLHARREVDDPRPQRFVAEVADVGPQGGDARVEEGVVHALELRGHDDLALDGALQLVERRRHQTQQTVELGDLDEQKGAHRVDGAALGVLGEGAGVDLVLGVQDLTRHLGPDLPRQCRHLDVAAPSRGTPGARLDGDNRLHELLGLLGLKGDGGVAVQPKHLGLVVERQLVDVRAVVVHRPLRRGVVDAVGGEGVLVGERLLADVLLQQHARTPLVPDVGDAAAVVDLADDVAECLERDLVLLVEVHPQVGQRRHHVRVVPLVRDVPPNRTKLAPLLRHGVEEGHREDELLEGLGLVAGVEVLVAQVVVGALDVGAQPLGGLVGELDAVLKHRHGEGFGRHGREPQSEVVMQFQRGHLL
mmetsp:Transcript_50868/g.110495  ORF Transcript_50868/g.110495 Transcript_50868/m.110495 type:complete len:516 (-) Transcript_50868:227-1774(-)